MLAGRQRPLRGDILLDDPPQAAPGRHFRRRLRHQPLPHQRVGRAVDIDIEPERQEMIVIDRHQVRRDQHTGLRVLRRRGVGHVARHDALDRIDAGRADLDADDPSLGQHPIDDVVVIADALDRPHDELDRRPPGMARVDPLGTAP